MASETIASSKPKRQKVAPASRDSPPSAAAASGSSGAGSRKRASEAEEARQLYGLYSTEFSDWCSGSWYPITFMRHPPKAGEAASGAGSAAAAAESASAATPAAAAAANPAADSIMVRWSSKGEKGYRSEALNLSFVRSGAEFTRLPVDHMTPRKRVLVRDVLEASDFIGTSYWLATLTSEPALDNVAKGKGGKKRTGSSQTGDIGVEYQNPLWPATRVPISSIFVLPKQRAELPLVPPEGSMPDSGPEDEEEEEDESSAQAAPAASAATAAAAPFAHSSPKLTSVSLPDSPARSADTPMVPAQTESKAEAPLSQPSAHTDSEDEAKE